jgi:ribosome-associated protein
MSRKRRKGYYVDGTFVRAGGALEAELGGERGADEPSRTARKKASKELASVGERLIEMRADELEALPLPDALREAVLEAKTITSFGARRRQVQYVGKLMRRLDEATIAAVRAALLRPD